MKKYLVFTFILVAAIASCKKEKEEPEKKEDPKQEDLEMKRITKHQWIVYRVEVGGTDFWNFPGAFQTCQKDDSYRFYKDSTLMQYENTTFCSGGKDSTASSWQFYDGRKKLIGTLLGITDTVGIISLEDTTMQLLADYQGNPATIFFKKK